MISIDASITDTATPALKEMIGALAGAEREALNTIGGRAATVAAREFHREFDRSGGWRKSGTPSSGSAFGSAITAGWNFLVADPTGALITNDAEHYGFKVRGGTITPKRVQFLTIPIVPEAKGLRVATYVQNTGRKLFTIPGRNALFERTDANNGESVARRMTGRNRDGSAERLRRKSQIRAVYALVRSVTQPPWPDALPPSQLLGDAFADAWLEEFIERFA